MRRRKAIRSAALCSADGTAGYWTCECLRLGSGVAKVTCAAAIWNHVTGNWTQTFGDNEVNELIGSVVKHNLVYINLMFVPCIARRSINNNTMHWIIALLYSKYRLLHVRQQFAVIRELLGFVWVTWNAEQIGGVSYNVSLCGLCAGVLWFCLLCFLCAGVLWFCLLCFPAHNKRNHTTPAHRPHKLTLYDTPPICSVFQVTHTDPRSSLMMSDCCRNIK
jgi:hypothetical protein